MIESFKRKASGAAMSFRARYSRDRLFSDYSRLSRAAGFDGLYFVLSFDCDSVEDIEAVKAVHSKLVDAGVTPSYAVSGPILEKGRDLFGKLASEGVEFINHGYSPHTYFNDKTGLHESCFFYDTLSFEDVAADIERGGVLFNEIIGKKPTGFRAPHFGTFQRHDQLDFLHSTLAMIGYRFSSSAMPSAGFANGAVYSSHGVAEFPISGMWSKPLSVLDTWEFLKRLNRIYNEKDYIDEASAISDVFRANSYVGLLNYYADPSHVVGSDVFFKAVDMWKSIAEPVSYAKLLDILARNKSGAAR